MGRDLARRAPSRPAMEGARCSASQLCACPPEDVGGAWGYAEMLDALANPEHEERDSYIEWLG